MTRSIGLSAGLVVAVLLTFIPVGADDAALDVSVALESDEGLSFATLTFTNRGQGTAHVGTVTIDWACADGFVERIDHRVRVSLPPEGSYTDGGNIVCAGRGGTLSYAVAADGGEGAATGIAGGNQVHLLIPCGDGNAVYVRLIWNDSGYFAYAAPNGARGTLSGKAVDEGTFARTVCDPAPAPAAGFVVSIKEYMKREIFAREGDPQLGYARQASIGTRHIRPTEKKGEQ